MNSNKSPTLLLRHACRHTSFLVHTTCLGIKTFAALQKRGAFLSYDRIVPVLRFQRICFRSPGGKHGKFRPSVTVTALSTTEPRAFDSSRSGLGLRVFLFLRVSGFW